MCRERPTGKGAINMNLPLKIGAPASDGFISLLASPGTVCAGAERNSLAVSASHQLPTAGSAARQSAPRFRLRLMRGPRLEPKLVAVCIQSVSVCEEQIRLCNCRPGDFSIRLRPNETGCQK